MAAYPYTLKPTSLKDFLSKMADRPEPDKVTLSYLSSLGYRSSNDRRVLTILRFIKFIDRGTPTLLFKNFRDTRKSQAIMAQALKESYPGVFQLSTDPSQMSDQDLKNFFRTATGRGGRALEATISTFRILCKFADFAETAIPTPPTPAPVPVPTPLAQLPTTREGGVTLNVNIRLELPATTDADVYDKIFESLKKHILAPGSKTD